MAYEEAFVSEIGQKRVLNQNCYSHMRKVFNIVAIQGHLLFVEHDFTHCGLPVIDHQSEGDGDTCFFLKKTESSSFYEKQLYLRKYAKLT